MPSLPLFAVIFCLSLLLTVPFFTLPMGGDILGHYVMIDCFSQQLREGDLYPRWCFAAAAGIGAPFHVFYPPLAYYITALCRALTGWNATTEQAYGVSALLASLVTGVAAWRWLRDVCGPGRALLGTCLYLLIPYRMEVLYFRAALAELWCMAFAPLVLLEARRLVQGEKGAAWWCTVWLALAFLAHAPDALLLAGVGGGYVLLTGRSWASLWRYGAAAMGAIALTAFYLVPASVYKPYIIADASMMHSTQAWPNNFIDFGSVEALGLRFIYVNLVLVLLATAVLAAIILMRRDRVAQAAVRSEAVAWVVICAVAALLMFPVSRPLWNMFQGISYVLFPWRMQMALSLGVVFLAAVRLRWLLAPRQEKNWPGDGMVLVVLLMLMAATVVTMRQDDPEHVADQSLAMHFIASTGFDPVWRREAAGGFPVTFAAAVKRTQLGDRRELATLVSGSGSIRVAQWNARGIVLDADMQEESVVRLDHLYFPVWRGVIDHDTALPLQPEEKTGLITMPLPAGRHTVMLTVNVRNPDYPAVGLSYLVSALAAAALMGIGIYMHGASARAGKA